MNGTPGETQLQPSAGHIWIKPACLTCMHCKHNNGNFKHCAWKTFLSNISENFNVPEQTTTATQDAILPDDRMVLSSIF
jgi:hypothetical protein